MLIYIIKRGALTNNSLLKAILSDWEPNIVMVYFSFRRPAVVYIGSIGNKSVLTLLERDIQCNGDLSVPFFSLCWIMTVTHRSLTLHIQPILHHTELCQG